MQSRTQRRAYVLKSLVRAQVPALPEPAVLPEPPAPEPPAAPSPATPPPLPAWLAAWGPLQLACKSASGTVLALLPVKSTVESSREVVFEATAPQTGNVRHWALVAATGQELVGGNWVGDNAIVVGSTVSFRMTFDF